MLPALRSGLRKEDNGENQHSHKRGGNQRKRCSRHETVRRKMARREGEGREEGGSRKKLVAEALFISLSRSEGLNIRAKGIRLPEERRELPGK